MAGFNRWNKPNVFILPLLADLDGENLSNQYVIEEVTCDTIVLVIKELNRYFGGKKFLVSITISHFTEGLPLVKIEPKIFHPHVNEDGILNYDPKHWTPTLKLSELVDAIQLLLSIEEEIADTELCANPEAAYYEKFDPAWYRQMVSGAQLCESEFFVKQKRQCITSLEQSPSKRVKRPAEDIDFEVAYYDNEDDEVEKSELNGIIEGLIHCLDKELSENAKLLDKQRLDKQLLKDTIHHVTSCLDSLKPKL